MHIKNLIFSVAIAIPTLTNAQIRNKMPDFPSMTGVNRIECKNTQYSKDTVSNGFLVNHNNKVYSVTSKHNLMLAKTDNMKAVELNNELFN